MTKNVKAQKTRWKILLAEDNAINQIVTKAQLMELGCQVDIAINGLEAIKAVEEQDFDLIIMDCNMPQVDGYEASRQIRKREKELGKSRIPIVAFTADVMHSEAKDCEAVGMTGYLTKPAILQDLQGILDKWLEKTDINISQPENEDGPLPYSENSLDSDVLHEMRRKLPIVQVNRIITLFLEELPTYIRKVQGAVISQNGEELYLAAHKFKGACLVLGAQRIVCLCDGFCHLGRNGRFDKPEELLRQLDQLTIECAILKCCLEQQISSE